ncbi:hypothetical protein HanIR_Chr08g0350491 [Helianthus annuus]|nr:hypothetical protein HanIR_Chr08g0350491 [Helianthus annuus]
MSNSLKPLGWRVSFNHLRYLSFLYPIISCHVNSPPSLLIFYSNSRNGLNAHSIKFFLLVLSLLSRLSLLHCFLFTFGEYSLPTPLLFRFTTRNHSPCGNPTLHYDSPLSLRPALYSHPLELMDLLMLENITVSNKCEFHISQLNCLLRFPFGGWLQPLFSIVFYSLKPVIYYA